MEETKVQLPAFLQGGGIMGKLIRSKDWSATSLGAPDTWPHNLRLAISMLLNSQFPMFIWWGKDLIMFYNDAYLPIAGVKHPNALGGKGHEIWAEVWPQIKVMVDDVFIRKQSTWAEDQQLYINRQGYMEEAYFTFSHSPILNDKGNVDGIFCVVAETTEKVLVNRKITKSEQNLRSTILQSPVAMCILGGPTFIVEIANERMYELWGRSEEELLHKPLFQALHEASNQGYEELLTHVYTTGKAIVANEQPVKVPRKEKVETIFVNLVYEPFHESDGTISGVIAVATDVTEQVINRKKVEEGEQKIRALVKSAPFPIGVYVGREMRIELVNQAIIDVWGKGSDVVGKLYSEVLPELENQSIYPQLDKVYTTGEPFHAKHQRVDLVFNGKLQPFYFNYSFTPLFDSEGKVYGVMNTAADVTDLVVAKQMVEQSEKNFRNMIFQAPVAMCILLGPEHVVDIANEAMIELWGKPKNDVLHKPIFEGLPDARAQGLEELLDHVYNTGETFKANERPVTLFRKGRIETVYQNFVYEPYRDSGGTILGVLAISIDVTEQVLARQKIEEVVKLRTKELAKANDSLIQTNEELKRTNANLEEFAYAASHDMKEPIRKIHFFADRLKNELKPVLNERQSHTLERLEHAAKRMNSLVEDLLTYSRVSQGIPNEEQVDLNKKVQNVLEDLELEIVEKGAKITVASLPTITGNKRQIQQLFQNLITNSLKYHKPNTSPELVISSKKVKGEEIESWLPIDLSMEYYLVEVKDNGIGFEQKDAERIFNVFTRLHANPDYRGTGVGLSIVRKVAENHNGYVWAKSEPDQGASFYVLLPANQQEKEL